MIREGSPGGTRSLLWWEGLVEKEWKSGDDDKDGLTSEREGESRQDCMVRLTKTAWWAQLTKCLCTRNISPVLCEFYSRLFLLEFASFSTQYHKTASAILCVTDRQTDRHQTDRQTPDRQTDGKWTENRVRQYARVVDVLNARMISDAKRTVT